MWDFTVSLSGGDSGVPEVHSGARHPLCVGLPTESGEQPDVWCPEELLAASVGSCLMTSFRHCLRQRGGEAHTYLSAVKATLGKTRSGVRITRVDVSTIVGVDGEANLAPAREAVREAERDSAVAHSLACPVTVSWEVNDASRECGRKWMLSAADPGVQTRRARGIVSATSPAGSPTPRTDVRNTAASARCRRNQPTCRQQTKEQEP